MKKILATLVVAIAALLVPITSSPASADSSCWYATPDTKGAAICADYGWTIKSHMILNPNNIGWTDLPRCPDASWSSKRCWWNGAPYQFIELNGPYHPGGVRWQVYGFTTQRPLG